ncbi:hypothetical protein [Marinobacterium sp. LSUCC0821]|uniref:hypothetical protein n=1 Tax=Marinobacterium sp. LSUCC0821 TaxID=2668067 RepID=UPI00145254A4|nr:hypothetical protein [Marinobacterium sp. LSUCC0821]QJD70561.1 hypothetical protein HH196_02060 [Marinobacterium sp. LSUCC0821]
MEDLVLCRDIHKTRIVFYWETECCRKSSPLFANKELACEWWRMMSQRQYKGEERRISTFDRRKNSTKRDHMILEGHQLTKRGRRSTDRRPLLSYNNARVKLESIQARLAERNQSDIVQE